jgi:hypothetical protein
MLDRPHCEQSPTFCGAETNPWQFALGLLLCIPLGCAGGCEREQTPSEPRFRTEGVRTSSVITPATADAGAAAMANADAGGDAAVPPWPGPFFTVISGSTGIYAQASNERSLKIGYARNGGRIPVLPNKLEGEGCRDGWYEGVGSGFICSSEGTVDDSDPRARLSATPPNLTEVLPYPYARNARNGTPLYNSVPSVDQMAAYEPRSERDSQSDPGAERPWWQRDKVQLSQVRLAELATESDGLLAKRLVQGFYIAIDREFEWGAHTAS